MQVGRRGSGLEIILFESEAALIKFSLVTVSDNYLMGPDDLSAAVNAVWYSRENLRASSMDDEDMDLWIEGLQEFRGEHRQLCEKWIQFLSEPKNPIYWRISMEEAEVLMMVLNDHRLFLAAEHELGEDYQMEVYESVDVRAAAQEIQFLDWLMELLLDMIGDDQEGIE